eukprot:PhF_6_TR2320/c0_g2_i9/m.4120
MFGVETVNSSQLMRLTVQLGHNTSTSTADERVLFSLARFGFTANPYKKTQPKKRKWEIDCVTNNSILLQYGMDHSEFDLSRYVNVTTRVKPADEPYFYNYDVTKAAKFVTSDIPYLQSESDVMSALTRLGVIPDVATSWDEVVALVQRIVDIAWSD